MSLIILVVGAVLALVGGYEVVAGFPYVRMEFGWTEVIAGTVALSGGVVTMAIAAIVTRLGSIRDGIARLEPARPGVTLRPAVLAEDESVDVPPPADLPVTPTVETPSIPASPPIADVVPPRGGLLQRFRSGKREAALPPDRRADVMFSPTSVPGGEVSPPVEPPGVAPPVSVHGEPEEDGVQAPSLVTEAPLSENAPESSLGERPDREIVGRYEAGGAFYTLFADGTIEVTKGETVRRFASMDELRSFVERQEAAELPSG